MRNILLSIFILCSLTLNGATYYVAPTGSDSYAGTFSSPFKSWTKGFQTAVAGDTVFFRGGVYYSVEVQGYFNSGTRQNPICFFGYPDDIANDNWPILDCFMHCDSITNPYGDVYNAGIYLDKVQFIHFKNLEVRNVYQCDAVLNGAITTNATANITYEQIRVHQVGERGYWHTSGAWSSYDSIYSVDVQLQSPANSTPVFDQPDTTRWINCDTWNICDTLSFDDDPGNGGDAWKVISYVGNYYYWEGCRAWNYSDDGFDPNKGERVFVDCWAMASNTYAEFGIEGNGFKSSAWRYGSDDKYLTIDNANDRRLVKQIGCLAMFCPGNGIYHGVESDSTDNSYWINNTAYKCGIGMSSSTGGMVVMDSIGDVFRNNLSYKSVYKTATDVDYNVATFKKYALSNNSWIRTTGYPNFEDIGTLSDADFVTTDSMTLVGLFTAPRQSNGDLPVNRPLTLSAGSDLRLAGIQIPESDSVRIQLTFLDESPDIGYTGITGILYDEVFVPGQDTISPTSPILLTAEAESDTTVSLTWAASIDNVAVSYYLIYRGEEKVDSTTSLSYLDSGLTPSTQYLYSIYARDAAFNLSFPSNILIATTNAENIVVLDGLALQDTLSSAPPGAVIFIGTEEIAGMITMTNRGTSTEPIYIGRLRGYTPVLTGNIVLDSSFVVIDSITIVGGITSTYGNLSLNKDTLVGGNPTVVINCANNDSVNIQNCLFLSSDTTFVVTNVKNLRITNNTVIGTPTKHVMLISPPSYDQRMRFWFIDYNHYSGMKLKFDNHNFWWWRAKYLRFDGNSTYNN